MSIGYIQEAGVGKSIEDYTNTTFEVRKNTGKVYPHPVEGSKVGDLKKGQIYTIEMYRAFIDLPNVQKDGRISMYHFDRNGSEIVKVDYSASMLDKIEISHKLNGRQIEVINSANTTLKSDVYNSGLYVEANYVDGETCFIELKVG